MPYASEIGFSFPVIDGSSGHWSRFPDPFDEGFRAAAAKSFARLKDDPMRIGAFVHNELAWGDELSLAIATLSSPEAQPAKRAFVEFLKGRHQSIEALNKAWGSSYESWDSLQKSSTPPARGSAVDPDLRAFDGMIADRYFAICREELKKAAPHCLYFGCRFASVNPVAIEAAAKHCDVISFNLYIDSVASYGLPEGVDMPVVIGEFSFGALDRGLFHPGLVQVASQADRAKAYASYVGGALRNPLVVGAHWFQYADEPAVGRADGENAQFGLVDVCDSPYKETVDVIRETSSSMYKVRSSSP